MSAVQRVLRACAFAGAAFSLSANAQLRPQPQTVYIPLGTVKVVKVASVASILRHFTAADLEMKSGDLIFAVDGEPVQTAEQFQDVFAKKTSDKDVRIDFLRNGVVRQSVGPLFRFDRGIFKSEKPRWGGDLETATVELAPMLLKKPVVRNVMALELASIKSGSAAGNAGLEKGDLLLTINGRSIGRASRSDILVPLFPEGTSLNFVYLRKGKLQSGHAVLTRVKTGFTKILTFGFSGESKMAEIESTDLPEEAPHDVKVEMPA